MGKKSMKCNRAVKLLFILAFSINLFAGNDNHKEYFISPSGSDKNNGSIKAPFATIERARDAVREDKLKSPESSYTVYLREGIYNINKSIEFDERDIFKDEEPLIFRSYKNEKVIISGGILIPENKISSVTDTMISRRFITRVKNNILQIDYSGININEGKILPHGFGRPYTNTQMELFGTENAYYLGRWPNNGYVSYNKVIDAGSAPSQGDYSNRGAIIEYDSKRVERWIRAEEPWIAGFFHYGFADDAVAIKKIDKEKKQITTAMPTYYGFSAGESFNSFYGFNILEEIDLPGEYFVDKKNKKIYFFPYENEDFSNLSLSIIEEPLLAIENSSYIYFQNIFFECTRGMGAYIEGGSDIHFTSCTFRNIGTAAICFGQGVDESGKPASRSLGNFKEYLYTNQTWDRKSGKDHLIDDCEIYNTGAGGIILGGGNRITLERGNNRVSNCSIYNFNRYEKTYRGAVNVDGVGNVIDHNDISNCPGVAIHLNGNEHLIEYNIFSDAVTDGHDMGVIYYGRNPSEQGNVIRYNYFHHNGNKDGTIMSVYHDDGACGMSVYGNVFYKPGNVAVMIGGGNDISYRNNIFIDAPIAFHIDNRLQNWGKEEFIDNNGVYNKRLSEVSIDKLPYSDAYPNLAKYWSDNLGFPKRNIIENNLFVKVSQIHNGSPEWVKMENNLVFNSDPGFESFSRMNFKLKNDSEVFTKLSDFENIPFEKMGRQKRNYNNRVSSLLEADTKLLHVHSEILMEDFKGVNGVYHGFAFMPEQIKKGMNDGDRAKEFSRIKNMELNIARTWFRPDWACGNNLYNDFNWESERMLALYKWLDEMKKLNVDIALQAGWWFTKDTYFHSPDLGGKDSIRPNPETDPDRFAHWVKESLHQLINVKGYTNIKYLILFTEPLNYKSGIVPEGFTQEEYFEKVCRKIHDELVNAGLRDKIKIVGPNSGSTRNGQWVGWAKNNLDDVIDIYSWHAYNATRWDREYGGWKEIAELGKNKIIETGKPFWIDEFGSGYPDEKVRTKPDYGNYLAQCIAAFIKSGAQTSLIWLLMDQQYVDPLENADGNDAFHNGVHRWGLTKWPHDNIKNSNEPYPAWYAFSMMSKYLGGKKGTKVFKTTNADSIYIIATKPSGKENSIMVVNASHSKQKFNIKFAQNVDHSFRRHLYDPANVKVDEKAEIIKYDKEFRNVQDNLTDELPSRGVAIYTTMN
jgi:hypothetical protein